MSHPSGSPVVFPLACVGVQFIATGMIDFLFKEETIVAPIKALETVNAQ